jgi:hypothetical protein
MEKNLLAILSLSFSFTSLFFTSSNAQDPTIVFQQTFGGSGDDKAAYTIYTSDKGFLNIGTTSSADGDFGVPAGHGNDAYAVKLDNRRHVVWKYSYGSSGDDFFTGVVQTHDGGYILSGGAGAGDGDVTGFHGGAHDVWIVKISAQGILQWQECFGGSGDDFGTHMKGFDGYTITGQSNSIDGDVTGNHGDYDAWVIKIDKSGVLKWQHSYGGSAFDVLREVASIGDGSYLLYGSTSSNDGDVSGNHGLSDGWWVKVDNLGNLLSQKCFGGSSDDFGYSISKNKTNYSISGLTYSNDGDIKDYHGAGDMYLFTITVTADVLWEKMLRRYIFIRGFLWCGACKKR